VCVDTYTHTQTHIYYLFIYSQERTNEPTSADGICPTILVYYYISCTF